MPQYAGEIAGVCSIAKACLDYAVVPIRLCNGRHPDDTYLDGRFLFQNALFEGGRYTKRDGHYTHNQLGINLKYQVDGETLQGIEYYGLDDIQLRYFHLFVSTDGKVYTRYDHDEYDNDYEVTDQQVINCLYVMLDKLPVLKQNLLNHVRRSIKAVPDIDAFQPSGNDQSDM